MINPIFHKNSHFPAIPRGDVATSRHDAAGRPRSTPLDPVDPPGGDLREVGAAGRGAGQVAGGADQKGWDEFQGDGW